MKKSTLALSVAAALAGFASTSASAAAVANGVGDRLIVPYFSAQSDNATLLNITNTDTVNGKVVKVRFRGAANSDDLFDFTLLLSPGDVWSAAVSQGANGIAQLSTADKSCTLPESVRTATQPFSTFRLDPSASDAAKANGTREGYVEIINMADIDGAWYATKAATVQASSLFKTVKHVSGVAPCNLAVLEDKLIARFADESAATAVGLKNPTPTLTSDWVIINQINSAAWSGSAVTFSASTPPDVSKVFWPQVAGDVTGAENFTADPLFVGNVIKAQYFDLPDLSTPYDEDTPVAQADAITAQLAVTSLANSYITDDSIGAVTDFLFSQPTRRYHVAVNYTGVPTSATVDALAAAKGTSGTRAVALYRAGSSNQVSVTTGTNYYAPANTGFMTGGRVLCLNQIKVPGRNNLFDREETTHGTTTTQFTISPIVPEAPNVVYFCGETNVVSINNAGTVGESALSASVTRTDITFISAYEAGWMRFSTPGAATGYGLPIVGGSFMRVNNGAQNYGFMFQHKATAQQLP